MKRNIPLVVFLLLLPLLSYSSQPGSQTDGGVVFDRESKDLGTIRETDGAVTFDFVFRNRSGQAVAIEYVSSTCGCTSPSHPRQPILPGQRGSIRIEYDPAGSSGKFAHKVYVRFNEGERHVLTVTGEVIPAPGPVDKNYPYSITSGIRLSALSIDFGFAEHGRITAREVGYINTSGKDVVLDFDCRCPYITFPSGTTVAAGKAGRATLLFDPGDRGLYGVVRDTLYPVIDGKRADVPLALHAVVIDSYPAAGTRKPEVEAIPMRHSFGVVQKCATAQCVVTIRNKGHAPLIIRWVESGDGLFCGLQAGTSIRPGKSVDTTVTLRSEGLPAGDFEGTLSIITNDPVYPLTELRFRARLR